MKETIYYECNEENYKFILNELHNKDKEIERLNKEKTNFECKCWDLQEEIDELQEKKRELEIRLSAYEIGDYEIFEDNRYKLIITELEKWLKEQLHYHKGVYFAYNGCDDLCEALNKLKELKESSNEEMAKR